MKKFAANNLQVLLDLLASRGYVIYGPQARDGAIVLGEITNLSDLPQSFSDDQDAGKYRLEKKSHNEFFGFNCGPGSWKQFLQPPKQTLFISRKNENGFQIEKPPVDDIKRAFLGVRACDIAALKIHDQVFNGIDHSYDKRRQNALIIHVECAHSASTCFCASMNTGPQVDSGYDLCLTELSDGNRHEFLARAGSAAGDSLLADLPGEEPNEHDEAMRDRQARETAAAQLRKLDSERVRESLMKNLEHPHWDDVASRCLSCTNCTMVCPTCFCSTVTDVTDLTGETHERVQTWDSCFNTDHSYVYGGAVRMSTKSRYRQWLTHKLSTWYEQFGSSGCVGCGRCIAWCPTGIDLTREVQALETGEKTNRE